VVDKKCLQVKNFRHLICEISCEIEKEIFNKIRKFSEILGITNNTFKPNVFQKFSIIKVYNTLGLPILLHGSEIWTLRKKDKQI
jgi:hypothetical protein